MNIHVDVFKEDKLGETLVSLIEKYQPKTILEIGASNGEGSTRVLSGAKSSDCKLFCIELDKARFDLLVANVGNHENVYPYNVPSCDVTDVMKWDNVLRFRKTRPKDLLWRIMTFKEVKKWYDNTIRDIQNSPDPDGIELIKNEHGIENFDMVFIDGGAFTGLAEMITVYGAKIIVMDDTMDIKCFDPFMSLLRDKNYELLQREDEFRNGFAVFKWRGYANS